MHETAILKHIMMGSTGSRGAWCRRPSSPFWTGSSLPSPELPGTGGASPRFLAFGAAGRKGGGGEGGAITQCLSVSGAWDCEPDGISNTTARVRQATTF